MSPAEAISVALVAAGLTRREQAVVLGESTQHWSRYILGQRSPSAVKVQGWLDRAATAGHRLALRWTAAGVKAEVL